MKPFFLLLTSLAVASALPPKLCTNETAIQRKEWGDMTESERQHYIRGIKCVMKLPSQFPEGLVPAATNRFFDFAGVHVNMTTSIHISGIFLSWHRHFLYLLEQILHNECAYPPYMGIPYWDWTKYPSLETSPIFDGGPSSLGGNGIYNNTGPYVVGAGQELPHGTGGGCVTTGPFGNMTVQFGPFNFNLVFTGLPSNWSQPNTRCLNRDLNDYGIATYDNETLVSQMLLANNITEIQTLMNSKNIGTVDRGLHGGGHYGVGGVMFDFFASPQDPSFFLHHGQIDRIWSQWQDSDPGTRRFQYNGTTVIFSPPDTPSVTNETVLDFDILGSSVSMHEVANPMAGPYCYKYL